MKKGVVLRPQVRQVNLLGQERHKCLSEKQFRQTRRSLTSLFLRSTSRPTKVVHLLSW